MSGCRAGVWVTNASAARPDRPAQLTNTPRPTDKGEKRPGGQMLRRFWAEYGGAMRAVSQSD
eukprot:COSAG01_NODE_5604_length_4152_cov_2.350851_5_plen_62_part_00